MPNRFWSADPALETRGIINKFSKKIVYKKRLDQQSLSDFLVDFRLLSAEEVINLYYGKVYRLKNITPNHLILKAKRRSGAAFHYIECKYHPDLENIEMEIKTPNAAAYFYVLWPLVIVFLLSIFGNTFGLDFSIFGFFLLLFYSAIAILIGIVFLRFSIDNVRQDLEKEMYGRRQLSPSKL